MNDVAYGAEFDNEEFQALLQTIAREFLVRPSAQLF